MDGITHFVVLRNLNLIPMKNFNLSLRKTYLVAIMGTMVLSSCSTDDTPSEDVSAIRQAEAANLNANAQVAAAEAALINAQVEVQVAQAEQIKLENALIAIQNASAEAESQLTIAELQAQMVAAETARVNAQLALNQAMNTLDESMAEMHADEVRNLMSKLSMEQSNLDQMMNDRNALVKDLNLANFNLEFGVDYSNESALISMQNGLESQKELLANLESNLVMLNEDASGKQNVTEKLNNLQSENISLENTLDSLLLVQNELITERNTLLSQVFQISNLKSDYEMYQNTIIGAENNKEALETTISSMKEQLTLVENQLDLSNTQLVEAQGRLDAANLEHQTRVQATAVARQAIPDLENTIENAELAYNMAVTQRNEYSGTDAAVISDLDQAVTDAGTALTDAQTALSDAQIVVSEAQNLENNYYSGVVAPEISTIAILNSDIDNLQFSRNNLQSDIQVQQEQLVFSANNLAEAEAFISENKEAYDQVVTVYETLYAEMQQIGGALNTITDLQNTLNILNSNNLSLINYYNNIKVNNTAFSGQVRNQEEQIANIGLGIKDLEAQIKNVENNIIIKVEDLQLEIDALTDQLAAMDVQIEAQTGVIAHYKDLLSQALAE